MTEYHTEFVPAREQSITLSALGEPVALATWIPQKQAWRLEMSTSVGGLSFEVREIRDHTSDADVYNSFLGDVSAIGEVSRILNLLVTGVTEETRQKQQPPITAVGYADEDVWARACKMYAEQFGRLTPDPEWPDLTWTTRCEWYRRAERTTSNG